MVDLLVALKPIVVDKSRRPTPRVRLWLAKTRKKPTIKTPLGDLNSDGYKPVTSPVCDTTMDGFAANLGHVQIFTRDQVLDPNSACVRRQKRDSGCKCG